MNKSKSNIVYIYIRKYIEVFNVLSKERKKQAFISLQLSLLSALLELSCLFSIRIFIQKISNVQSAINQAYPTLIQDIFSFFNRIDIIYFPILCILTFLISAATRVYTIIVYTTC